MNNSPTCRLIGVNWNLFELRNLCCRWSAKAVKPLWQSGEIPTLNYNTILISKNKSMRQWGILMRRIPFGTKQKLKPKFSCGDIGGLIPMNCGVSKVTKY